MRVPRRGNTRGNAQLMPLLIIPCAALSEAALLLRRIAQDDYSVDVAASERSLLIVGRIMRVARSSVRTAWFWTITGPAAPHAGIALVGEADDLEAAKAALRQSFDRLLHWAAIDRPPTSGPR